MRDAESLNLDAVLSKLVTYEMYDKQEEEQNRKT